MNQLDLLSFVPPEIMGDRDGVSFDRTRDLSRLDNAMGRIFNHMQDGRWYTLAELAEVGECSEACASARCRDLRKVRFGHYQINKSHCGNGLWKYRFAGKQVAHES